MSALPAIASWTPVASWGAIDFISDLHLAPDHPRTVQAFVRYLAETAADVVLLLGDVFEVWVGDDSHTLPFERSVLAPLAEAARRRCIAFMPGNRDFLVGAALLQATGVGALPEPCCLHAAGRRWLLAHGDAQCLADTSYQDFRAQVRSPAWQQAFLAQPLTERLAQARAMRLQSMRAQQAYAAGWLAATDLDAAACRGLLQACAAQEMIHGHTHRPAVHDLGQGLRRHVLSDWDLDDARAPRAEVLRLTATGSLRRLAAAAAGRR